MFFVLARADPRGGCSRSQTLCSLLALYSLPARDLPHPTVGFTYQASAIICPTRQVRRTLAPGRTGPYRPRWCGLVFELALFRDPASERLAVRSRHGRSSARAISACCGQTWPARGLAMPDMLSIDATLTASPSIHKRHTPRAGHRPAPRAPRRSSSTKAGMSSRSPRSRAAPGLPARRRCRAGPPRPLYAPPLRCPVGRSLGPRGDRVRVRPWPTMGTCPGLDLTATGRRSPRRSSFIIAAPIICAALAGSPPTPVAAQTGLV